MDGARRTILDDAALQAEMSLCEYCEARPCRDACPAHCSPADFIMAARVGEPQDFGRAAAMILAANPLGETCGTVCPDTHCVAACARNGFAAPVDIPAVQAAIIRRAREGGLAPSLDDPTPTGRRVAVVGSGPAGLAAAAVLARHGHAVDVLDASDRPGGMAALIPGHRLDPDVLARDVDFVAASGAISVTPGVRVGDPEALLAEGYDAVVLATGRPEPLSLGVPGEEAATRWTDWLDGRRVPEVRGRRVAVVGGGAVAADCAEVAMERGAAAVELIALESVAELPLTTAERAGLVAAGVEVTGRTRVTAVAARGEAVNGIETIRVELPAGEEFHPSRVRDVPGTAQRRPDVDVVVVAIGAAPDAELPRRPEVFPCGDLVNGPSTVVEAVAAGKNVAAAVHAVLSDGEPPAAPRPTTSMVRLRGVRSLPVPLDTEFFGIPLPSPFLLSAAPPTDGYGPMRRAYEAGWAGGIMKTAFDGLAIHVPAEYMFAFSERTFANCDNVSDHPLDRVCGEIERLRREFPDRLTMASTGGPVTGRDEDDAAVWQGNTAKLERAGACGIEYSLSCPQGGDGTKGDIVSQDAELTAKIVEWVLAAGDPDVPKLFKLTGAVTSIVPIVAAVAGVLARHPRAKAGITLANTFPTLAFRHGGSGPWDDGIVVGMSGEGVTPISYLTLAKAAPGGVTISGNGGPMDYRAAADFLALGASTVQFCSVVMKYGVGIVGELHSGLSHLLAARGLESVAELIGRALPHPVTPFDALPAGKGVSAADRDRCRRCGNCSRCPYLAIEPDDEGFPRTDPERCVGCGFCALQCFAGAIALRPRTPAELA